MPEKCPNCDSPLTEKAVLCVQCGFDLRSGTILATQFERAPVETAPALDTNPYASPAIEAAPPRPGLGSRAEFDLTPHAASRAKAVVRDADSVFLVIVLALCFCGYPWFLMLPWYGFRLVQWYELNRQFEELRHPNALSPYSDFTVRFPDAKWKLWTGVVVGTCLLSLLAYVYFGR